MKAHTTRSLFALLAAIFLFTGGCSTNDPAAPDPVAATGDDFSAMDFDAPFGGLTMSDEPPAFDDPYLLADDASEDGEAYADDLADDPVVQAMIAMGEAPGDPDDPLRPRFTFLRILWGKLDLDESDPRIHDDTEEVDWSGRLRVDRGVVLVRRVISFERPEDRIIRPRPDRHTVAWHSHAGRDHDGLLIQIIEPPHPGPDRSGDDVRPTTPNRLHVTTGPFTQVFLVSELTELDAVYPVEAPGQAIHFTGFTLGGLNPCPKGFLGGRWMFHEDSEFGGGTFYGRWIGLHGPVLGYLRGAWGFNAEGERVFFGKYIDRQGVCLGLLAGTWAPGQRPNMGWLRGRWFGHDEQYVGVLDGHYRKHPEYRMGSFQGRWAALCDDEASGQVEGP